MWWLVWLTLAGVFAALNDGPRRHALLIICTALIVGQVLKFIPIGEMIWLCYAAVWVTVGGLILRSSHINSTIAISSTLAIISGLCYLVGRVGGYDFAAGANHMWESPLFWADMALLASICTIGGQGAWATISRSFKSLSAYLKQPSGAPSYFKGRSGLPSQSIASSEGFATAKNDGGHND